MQNRYTKTFVENRWYKRISPGVFDRVPAPEEGASLDAQVREWVDETGHVIIHPGQIGMHTSWHGDANDPYQIKCLTFGLTVLYQEAGNGRNPIQHADPDGIDGGGGTAYSGTPDPRGWRGVGSPADGTRPTA